MSMANKNNTISNIKVNFSSKVESRFRSLSYDEQKQFMHLMFKLLPIDYTEMVLECEKLSKPNYNLKKIPKKSMQTHTCILFFIIFALQNLPK